MNKKYILWNLREALGEMQRTIAQIEADDEYEYAELVVDMSHIYHHINTAWNSRNSSEAESEECSEENFNKWRAMPAESELYLGE